jgi:hypothetical protein
VDIGEIKRGTATWVDWTSDALASAQAMSALDAASGR